MIQVCPFCGASIETTQAPKTDDPNIIRCPECSALLDLPQGEDESISQNTKAWEPESTESPAWQTSFSRPETPPIPQEAEANFQDTPARPETQETAGPTPEGPAWENQDNYLGAFFRTIKQVLFKPSETFSAPAAERLAWPISFALILGTLGGSFQLFWNFLGNQAQSHLVNLLFTPFLVIIGLFVGTAVIHFMLFILRGTKNGFLATFRVVCYGNASSIFFLLPYVGVIISLVWGMVILVNGLAVVHETTRFRAFMANLLPFIIIFLLVLAVIIFTGAGALLGFLAAQKSMMSY
ncbi:YIP1 family protein [Dethiosulfatarculus sandiegensis]|uniref:YIP1 family protein n=1 Tax=Dethiosulfatarculus sandiegensis TaxID=1429043 RepID=UPI0018D19FC3|nr:YIP1 family protein [Dethiosulfatarculus sandiegensis]